MCTTDDHTESLASALTKARFPVDNHEFIRHITDTIGISDYRFVDDGDKRYIAAIRRDGRGELRIHYGFTNRFVDEDEARRVGAGADMIRESSQPGGGWMVSHPEHGDLDRRTGGRRAQRESRLCPNGCGFQLTASGLCPGCDDH
ncbi:hypothetical protein ACWDTI_23755 [Gordonia sp. NPDC003424]